MKKLVTNILLDAMIERKTRKGQFKFIKDRLHCTDKVVKELVFAFLYKAEEQFLRNILDGVNGKSNRS